VNPTGQQNGDENTREAGRKRDSKERAGLRNEHVAVVLWCGRVWLHQKVKSPPPLAHKTTAPRAAGVWGLLG